MKRSDFFRFQISKKRLCLPRDKSSRSKQKSFQLTIEEVSRREGKKAKDFVMDNRNAGGSFH